MIIISVENSYYAASYFCGTCDTLLNMKIK